MPAVEDAHVVESLVSNGRFAPFLAAAGGDDRLAVELYQWSVRTVGASFETFHYVEVVVRNSIDRVMSEHRGDTGRGIPWFLLPMTAKGPSRFEDSVSDVRKRLRHSGQGRESRDQIVAGLSFGTWTSLLHTEHDELWKQALHRAFPHSSGKRADVVSALEALRGFRNRLAHHDSLLQVDVAFRLSQVRDVLRWVDPAAEAWFDHVERVNDVLAARPLPCGDAVVVVAAREAWPFYEAVGAYVCQAGRSFQPVDRLSFYSDKQIHTEIPLVRRRIDHVEWSEAEVNRLRASSAADDQRLADIIAAHRALGWPDGRNQVFILSRPGEAGHETLPAPVLNLVVGRGSAYTQGQRCTTLKALRAAQSTADL